MLLYCLSERDFICFKTYRGYHHDNLRMKSIAMDLCLLYLMQKDSSLDILVRLQVDDSIDAGSLELPREEAEVSS